MRTKDELAFDAAFDERGMIRDGISKVLVPIKLIDSIAAPAKPKRPDYYVRVDASIALDSGEYVRRRPKKIQKRNAEGEEEGTEEFEDRQPGFAAKDAVVRAVLDDCYDTYDASISQQWRNKSTQTRDASKQCSDCGASSALDANFCADCGSKFGDDDDDADDDVDDVVAETTTHNYDNLPVRRTDAELAAAGWPMEKPPNKLVLGKQGLVLVLSPQEVAAANAVKDAAYSEYDSDLANAWRAK